MLAAHTLAARIFVTDCQRGKKKPSAREGFEPFELLRVSYVKGSGPPQRILGPD